MRFETNHYSVPVRSVGSRLTLKADPFTVRLYAGTALVAAHPRSSARQQIIEDFRHYVLLLLDKRCAVPFASALHNGTLPSAWKIFLQRLVVERAALGLHDGNREFARLPRLCLTHSVAEVGAALELAAASSRFSAVVPTLSANCCSGRTNQPPRRRRSTQAAIPRTTCHNRGRTSPPTIACS